MKSKKAHQKLPSTREGLIKWLTTFWARARSDMPDHQGEWVLCWKADGLVTEVTESSLRRCKTEHSPKEKKKLIQEWGAMSTEEREILREMGADTYRSLFPDGESDRADQIWTHSETGKNLNARFAWEYGNWLFLTHFNGHELTARELFKPRFPFKGWRTAQLRELRDYLIRVTEYIKRYCTDELVVAEDVLWRISNSSTSEEADPTKQAIEVVRNMTADTWKQDRGRLLNILSESANAARPGVE